VPDHIKAVRAKAAPGLVAPATPRTVESGPPEDPVALAVLNPPPAPVGGVTAATWAEIGLIGEAARRRPGLVAAALAMAELIDDPHMASVAPAAAEQLIAALEQLHRL
jgi:hypothetical protein